MEFPNLPCNAPKGTLQKPVEGFPAAQFGLAGPEGFFCGIVWASKSGGSFLRHCLGQQVLRGFSAALFGLASPEGLFSDNSRSPLQSSCCWTGNNPIPGLSRTHATSSHNQKYRGCSRPRRETTGQKKKFSSAPAGRKLRHPCPPGHRMNGSAHLSILCPQNTLFRRKPGHRMNESAHPFILWHKNESAERNGGGAEAIPGWIGRG